MLSPQLSRAIHRFWFPTAMMFFLNGLAFGGWAAQVPRATQRLQMDEGTLGLILLGMGVGAVAAMAFSGRMIARYGAGLLIRLSLVVFLASYIVLSTAPTLELFAAAVLLFGAAGGLMDVAMNAYASDVEAHMDWRVMASFHGMWSVGGLVGAAATSYLLGVSSDLTQALALSAVVAVLFLTCQHNLIALRHHVHEKSSQRLVIGRLTLIIALLAALAFSAEGAVRDWSSLFLAGDLQASIDRAAWGYAAFSATMAACRLSGDWMRVRFGERNVVVISGIVAVDRVHSQHRVQRLHAGGRRLRNGRARPLQHRPDPDQRRRARRRARAEHRVRGVVRLRRLPRQPANSRLHRVADLALDHVRRGRRQLRRDRGRLAAGRTCDGAGRVTSS